MKRPNLVNPSNWTPFKSVPIANEIAIEAAPREYVPKIERPSVEQLIISQRQRNSFWLNVIGFFILLAIGYFLYNIYLERKIYSNYLEYLKNRNDDNYPGFISF